MLKRTNKLDKVLKEKYELYSSEFEKEIENAVTIEEYLHVYARYTGRLEGIIEGLIMVI